jgi:hypothetical protein
MGKVPYFDNFNENKATDDGAKKEVKNGDL